jgi:hypothetical protein
MHHVKSEHGKDEDDDLDDDRKPDLGHHGHHPYYQHSMSMGGHYNSHHHLKSEIDSKNQTGSDCGVPIPASKPKIWSLADTAACKTPPPHLHPNAGQWAYHQATQQHPSHQYSNHLTTNQQQQSMQHLHQQQHPSQSNGNHQQQPIPHHQHLNQQQHHLTTMGMESIDNTTGAGMDMNMITSGHHSQAMSGMMNTFGGNSVYTRYAGFLTTPTSATHPIHQQQAQVQQQPQQHPYINHNHTEGSITSVTPNSTGQPTTPTLQQNTTSQTSNNQTMGFPEVQTGKLYFYHHHHYHRKFKLIIL